MKRLFVLRPSSFVIPALLFFLLAPDTWHLTPVLSAQQISVTTPIRTVPITVTTPQIAIQSATAQTSNEQEWKNSAGALVTYVDKDGVLHFPGGGGGISAINGLMSSAQFFVVCSTGLDFNIQDNIDTHSLCIPDASATARGLVTTGAQIFAGPKTLTGSTLIDNDLYVTGNFSTDHPIEITGEACGTAEANVGLFGFDPVTGLPCFSYDGGVAAPFVTSVTASAPLASSGGATPDISCPTCVTSFPRLDQVLDPTADKPFVNGTHTVAFTNVSIGSFGNGWGQQDKLSTSPFAFGSMNLAATGFHKESLVSVLQDDTADDRNSLYSIVLGENAANTSRTLTAHYIDAVQEGNGDIGSLNGINIDIGVDGTGAVSRASGIFIQTLYGNSKTQNLNGVFNSVNANCGAIRCYGYYANGTAPSYMAGGLSIGVDPLGVANTRLTVKSGAASITPVTFTGAGLDDATSGGTFTGLDDLAYCVQIDASVPSPDTFEWGTAGSCSSGATGVGITGAAQNLSNGVQITFAAIDGHTIGDNWTFTAYAPIPLTLQDHNGNITAKVRETGDVLARRFHASTGTALVSGDFVTAGWQAGNGGIGTITGTDQAFQFTMTATAGGIALNPTATLTFHDGTWTTAPVFVCNQNGGTGAQSFITVVPSATTALITYLGTPITTLTYVISCVGMGI